MPNMSIHLRIRSLQDSDILILQTQILIALLRSNYSNLKSQSGTAMSKTILLHRSITALNGVA